MYFGPCERMYIEVSKFKTARMTVRSQKRFCPSSPSDEPNAKRHATTEIRPSRPSTCFPGAAKAEPTNNVNLSNSMSGGGNKAPKKMAMAEEMDQQTLRDEKKA